MKDFRKRAMHNRLYIGRQLAHIPGIDISKLSCPLCDFTPNTIEHLMLNCHNAFNSWTYLSDRWSEIIGSYEDFVDEPIGIPSHFKILGIPTLKKPSKGDTNNYNMFILLHSLDILLGNMQFTLIKQHHAFLKASPETTASTTYASRMLNQTTYIFDHHMAHSLNKIHNRFKRAPYVQQWIFKKPENFESELPVTASNWPQALRDLVISSLVRPTQTTSPLPNDTLIFTSELDSDLSSDDGD